MLEWPVHLKDLGGQRKGTDNHAILAVAYETRNYRTLEALRHPNTERPATSIRDSGHSRVALGTTALGHESVSARQGCSFVTGRPWLVIELWRGSLKHRAATAA